MPKNIIKKEKDSELKKMEVDDSSNSENETEIENVEDIENKDLKQKITQLCATEMEIQLETFYKSILKPKMKNYLKKRMQLMEPASSYKINKTESVSIKKPPKKDSEASTKFVSEFSRYL